MRRRGPDHTTGCCSDFHGLQLASYTTEGHIWVGHGETPISCGGVAALFPLASIDKPFSD